MAGARTLVQALGLFVAWVAATWAFEGRIETLLRPDATLDRIVYAFVVNLLLGIVGGVLLLRRWRASGALDATRAGFGAARRRTAATVAAGLALGLAAYVLQGAPSADPVVVGNAFAQVFVVSAAEVVVCWSVVGAATEVASRRLGTHRATLAAAVVASVLFGLYHYAHSAPFNTLPMVALLVVVGLVTGTFFFVGRDVLGTAVFHNWLGTYGVVQALAAADALGPLRQWQPSLLFSAALALLVLGAGYAAVGRAARRVSAR